MHGIVDGGMETMCKGHADRRGRGVREKQRLLSSVVLYYFSRVGATPGSAYGILDILDLDTIAAHSNVCRMVGKALGGKHKEQRGFFAGRVGLNF